MAVRDQIEDASGGGTTPAIAIFVFGRKEYSYAANHLALTLSEHSLNVPIHVWCDPASCVDPSLFAEVHELPYSAYENGPGRLKLHVHDLLPQGDWLYLDADMLCIADIGLALEKLKTHDFALDVRGQGKKGEPIPYTPWATPETIERVAELPSNAIYFGVQTSWMWIRKGSEKCKAIFDTALSLPFQTTDLKEQWGGSIPDELCISAALSKLNHVPFSLPLSFYGTLGSYSSFSNVKANHVFACLYGDMRRHRLVATSWIDQYDRYIRSMYQRRGKMMGMDIHRIMKNKHVTQ